MIDFITNKFKDFNPYINNHEKMNKYSVFIPLVKNKDNETCILFQVRSKNLRNQPSEVSFPGGKIESNETPSDAAIRETCEELGFTSSNLEIISSLDLFIHYSSMIIHPYVGIIKDLDLLDINTEEVEEIFLVPIDYLLSTKPDYYSSDVYIRPNENFPYELIPEKYNYKFKESTHDVIFYRYNNYVIWGITATILENFISVLKR